jgi:hypothetical protein
MHTGFWSENPKERQTKEDRGLDVMVIFEVILNNRIERWGLEASESG